MDKIYDIAALGELLVDFTPAGKSLAGMELFEQNPGGAPANMLTAAARSGLKAAFLGKVGKDMHGEFLRGILEAEGIETKGLVEDESVFTTLAFVKLDGKGNRTFSFARKPGADTMLRERELDMEILGQCRMFHTGSLSLTNEPSKGAAFAAVKAAKKAGAIISYDPNYREPLWGNPEEAAKGMREMLPFADLVKVSDEEAELVAGTASPEKAAEALIQCGAALAAVTMGGRGALIRLRSGESEFVPAYRAQAVDTTGAGDTFWGGFLACLAKSGKAPEELKISEAREFALYGSAAAALCVGKRGGIPSIPHREGILRFMEGLPPHSAGS